MDGDKVSERLGRHLNKEGTIIVCESHRSINQPRLHKMADKLRTTQQLEALQNKYVGTGHADTTRFEWTSNIQRDSLASYVGHPPLLSYMTLAMGEGTREEMRVKLIEKMVRPVGPPPEVHIQYILS
jgi:splicing factor 3B subunit 5